MKKLKTNYVFIVLLLCTISHNIYAQKEVKKGSFRTGDDCDQIYFSTSVWNPADGNEAKKGPPQFIGFILNGDDAGKVTWWKKISIPIKGGGFKDIVFENNNSNSTYTYIKFEDLDFTRNITVYKAKMFGAKTKLNYNFNIRFLIVSNNNINYESIKLKWVKDKCGN
jgi:hypothetical protein